MTNNNHPITPPPELVQKIADEPGTWLKKISKAYCAGADQELEACLKEIRDGVGRIYIFQFKLRDCLADDIWTVRRFKPPSLKEQALEALDEMNAPLGNVTASRCDIIRRALEALPD